MKRRSSEMTKNICTLVEWAYCKLRLETWRNIGLEVNVEIAEITNHLLYVPYRISNKSQSVKRRSVKVLVLPARFLKIALVHPDGQDAYEVSACTHHQRVFQ